MNKQRAALPASTKIEDRAVNTVSMREQKAALPKSERDEKTANTTIIMKYFTLCIIKHQTIMADGCLPLLVYLLYL